MLRRASNITGQKRVLGYRKYPCNICISINEEVVHGLANDRRLQFGDLVSLDVGVVFHGYVGDTARTVAAGGCSLEAQRLMDVTERALMKVLPGDRGHRVTTFRVRSRIMWKAMASVLCANLLGMALAFGPRRPQCELRDRSRTKAGARYDTGDRAMVNAGGPGVKILKDGWTAVTQMVHCPPF